MAGRVIEPSTSTSTIATRDVSVQTVTLEEVQYRLRLAWRERCRGWYLDLYLLDGTPIVQGRRICPGIPVLIGAIVANAPPGMIVVRGADDYARADLGVSLFLIYYAIDEISSARDLLDGVTEDPVVIEAA